MADLKTIYDHYIVGGVDGHGTIKQVWGSEALSNAIRVWIGLSQGELLRNAEDGGFLISLLTKPMSPEASINIKEELLDQLSSRFAPRLSNISVEVTPNYSNKTWLIQASAYCAAIKDSVTLETQVRNLG